LVSSDLSNRREQASDDSFSEDETTRCAEDALRRALSTPHKPHKPAGKKGKGAAHSVKSSSEPAKGNKTKDGYND
jgi:hypothetical protein